ncbi:unnamed protein product [Adineta ricciae]|uniref:Uncharacterized protein n=1 Tax=Adineta ricciae TaxID=249248 RepID=A0A814GPE4_ADIRI|nr:unnamed protein product [Adineta ricciae]CAF1434255.1 unnamed protein product [Adineta ricciae]
MHNLPPPKAVIVTWTDFTREQTRKLEELSEPESINEFFIKIFSFERNTKRTIVLCDLFYYALQFARKNQFNHEQISSFLSILKCVHDLSNRTSYANMEQTYEYFKALILKHSLFRPPHNLRIFTPDLTKKITDYVIDTYFRHIKMYKYIFTPYVDFSLNFTFEGMTQKIEESAVVEENVDATQEQIPETEENSDLVEVRKLVQSYMQEELRKIENTTEEQPRQTEKQKRIKSSSSRSSKPRTPK